MKTNQNVDMEEQMENHCKTKTMVVTIEVYDDTTVEEMENIIEYALNHDRVDCMFNVEEM